MTFTNGDKGSRNRSATWPGGRFTSAATSTKTGSYRSGTPCGPTRPFASGDHAVT
jgi:hypothetical protein